MRIAIIALLAGVSIFGADKPQKRSDVYGIPGVFPQIAVGGGWSTTITLVNMDDKDVAFTLSFYDDNGNPMTLNIAGVGSVSKLQGTINHRGSRVLETSDSGRLTTGWAYFDSWDRIGTQAVFRQRVPGRPDFEAVVPICDKYDDKFVLAYDNAGGAATGFAIVNGSDYSSTTVTAAFFDENGSRYDLDQFTLDAGQHQSFMLGDRWPQTRGRRGTVEFSGSGLALSAIGLRANSSGAFTSLETLSSIARP